MGLDALAPPPLTAPKAAKIAAATIDKEMASRLNDNVGSAQVKILFGYLSSFLNYDLT